MARGTNSLWNLPCGSLGPPTIACVLGLGQTPVQSLRCSLGVWVQPEAHSPGAQHLQVAATTSQRAGLGHRLPALRPQAASVASVSEMLAAGAHQVLFQGARFLMRVPLPSILSSGLEVNVARLGVTFRHTKTILCAGLNVSLQQDWDTCVLSGQPAVWAASQALGRMTKEASGRSDSSD